MTPLRYLMFVKGLFLILVGGDGYCSPFRGVQILGWTWDCWRQFFRIDADFIVFVRVFYTLFVAGSRARIAGNIISRGTVDRADYKLACIVLGILSLRDVMIFGDFRPLGA